MFASDLDLFREKREASPVGRDPTNGVWNVYRYDDVVTILSGHRTFSSDFGRLLNQDYAELTEGNILATDPPRHHQLRALVSQAFSPRAIARLESRIELLTEELLDQIRGCTRIELVSDLAFPLPATVIAELLGVPASDRPIFKTWTNAILDQTLGDPDDKAKLEAAAGHVRRFHDYLREHVTRRRVFQCDDLLSDLIGAEIDGQRLSDAEIVGFATILLIAGHVTTMLLLGNTILCLEEHPEAQAELRADPSRIPAAIEEVLRYRSPVAQTRRIATGDVELRGMLIGSGQQVNVWLVSANHDERQFAHPDEFLIDRAANPHVAFGRGIHFCLGAPLARLESRVALAALLRHYSHLRIDPDQPPDMYTSPSFVGARTLSLEIEPA